MNDMTLITPMHPDLPPDALCHWPQITPVEQACHDTESEDCTLPDTIWLNNWYEHLDKIPSLPSQVYVPPSACAMSTPLAVSARRNLLISHPNSYTSSSRALHTASTSGSTILVANSPQLKETLNQPLSQQSNCCRSRKCTRWHIPVHAIYAVFYLFFLPAVSWPSLHAQKRLPQSS